MNDDELIHALVRLDDALKTLENRLPGALAPVSIPLENHARDSALADLEARHAALRDRTAAAVDRLSILLDAAGGA